jgi:hypothetical protein
MAEAKLSTAVTQKKTAQRSAQRAEQRFEQQIGEALIAANKELTASKKELNAVKAQSRRTQRRLSYRVKVLERARAQFKQLSEEWKELKMQFDDVYPEYERVLERLEEAELAVASLHSLDFEPHTPQTQTSSDFKGENA